MLRPALNSTEDPPSRITDQVLQEYVNELRRRIEVQNIQMEALAVEVRSLQIKAKEQEDFIDRLSLDLALYNKELVNGAAP
jgi:ABC-type phosphate transport system auxiliary subunit